MPEKTLEQQIEELEIQAGKGESERAAEVITEDTKLSVLWIKVRPFVALLSTMVRRKIKKYISAFLLAIDEITAKESDEETEEGEI